MDKTTTVKVSFGGFTFKNILTIGEQNQIAVHRATISNGMYGQMMQSPNTTEVNAAFNLLRTSEMEGRLVKAPEDFEGVESLQSDQFDELWKEWTVKSGLFLRKEKSTDPDSGDGEGKDQS